MDFDSYCFIPDSSHEVNIENQTKLSLQWNTYINFYCSVKSFQSDKIRNLTNSDFFRSQIDNFGKSGEDSISYESFLRRSFIWNFLYSLIRRIILNNVVPWLIFVKWINFNEISVLKNVFFSKMIRRGLRTKQLYFVLKKTKIVL